LETAVGALAVAQVAALMVVLLVALRAALMGWLMAAPDNILL
jgi:hypothetical protein